MKMKKTVLFMAMVAASLHGFAQHEVGKLTFIPKVGVNLSTVQGDEVYYLKDGVGTTKLEPQWRIGMNAGIEGEYQMSKQIALSAGVVYSLQGMKYGDIEYQRNYTSTFPTVHVPLLLNFYVVKGLAVKAGLQAGYTIKKGESYELQEGGGRWVSYKSSGSIYKEFDVSVPVGVSYDIERLRLELRYNHGLTSISDLKGLPSTHHRVFQFSVGYSL
jgi:hypothetical protein